MAARQLGVFLFSALICSNRALLLRPAPYTSLRAPERQQQGGPLYGSDGGKGEPFLIKLDQFLKKADIVGSGGEAKTLIKEEEVSVNGMVETRRGRKLRSGDVVTVFEVGSYDVERLLAGEEAAVVDPPKLAVADIAPPADGAPPSAPESAFVLDEELGENLDDYEEDVENFLDELANSLEDLDEDEDEDEDEAFMTMEEDSADDADASVEAAATKASKKRQMVARGTTRGGLSVVLRRAKSRDLHAVGQCDWASQCPGLPSGKDNNHVEAAEWVVAELERGFAGIVGLVRAGQAEDGEGGVDIRHLTVAPSSRQRGVAGALIDYVLNTAESSAAPMDDATPPKVRAVLPKYKNKVAKATMEAFFESRGVQIKQKF